MKTATNKRKKIVAPPGYVTRERADRLKAALLQGMREITDRLADRAVPLISGETDPAKIEAILECEVQKTLVEIDTFQAQHMERLNAGEEH